MKLITLGDQLAAYDAAYLDNGTVRLIIIANHLENYEDAHLGIGAV